MSFSNAVQRLVSARFVKVQIAARIHIDRNFFTIFFASIDLVIHFHGATSLVESLCRIILKVLLLGDSECEMEVIAILPHLNWL